MMMFWFVAAALIVAALLFVLPPLLRRHPSREPESRDALNISIYRGQFAELDKDLERGVLSPELYEQGKQELERRLLNDLPVESASKPGKRNEQTAAQTDHTANKLLAGILLVLVPVLSVVLYQKLGTPEAINFVNRPPASVQNQQPTAEQINQMVDQLAARLQEQPDDADGWAMLARSYFALRRFPEASMAFSRAVALVGDNPQLLVDYADTLAMAAPEQSLEGKPIELITRALTVDPNNQKGLWLAGTAAFELADYGTAVEYWQRLLDTVPAQSETAQIISNNILEARKKSGDVAVTDGAAGQGEGQGAEIHGTVSLDSSLSGAVEQSDVVFIFARAIQGPPMPLAVERILVKDLPYRFTLTDAMAIMPAMTISRFAEVSVSARISKTGDAIPQTGDLEAAAQTFKVGSENTLGLLIDQVVQ